MNSIAAIFWLSACAASQAPPPSQPAPPATAPATPAPDSPATPPRPRLASPRHPDAEGLLNAAERVSATLQDFTAQVMLQTTDSITNDTERRSGQVVFLQEAGRPETRKFAVVFTSFIDGSGRMDERPVRYIYSDGWLTEADFTQRTLIRRQLARAGESFDPLKPGNGPLPLPVGQRKDDVMKRFEVALVETPTSPLLTKLTEMPGGVQGVVMTPRPGMADRDLVKATVWYDLRSMAPVAVEAERRNGHTVVLLRKTAVNAGLSDEQRALLTLAAGQTKDWRVDEQPLPPKAP